MTRAAILLFICVILPAGLWSRPAVAAGFDAATAASVWTAALTYIAPRALQQVSLPQMTVWGLNGLTALDPDISAVLQDNELKLFGPSQMLLALPAPQPDDVAGWGKAAAAIAAAAYAASPALQTAGTQGLISSFFDELFNHYDPYSRYEPPLQAAQEQLMITGLAGAGLTLGRQGSEVIITAVDVDGPAAEAGLTAGTQVLAIDGRAVYPSEIAALNNNLMGIAGSTTTLHVLQDDIGTTADIPLIRTYIPPQTVFLEDLGNPAPAFISLKISSFNKGTSDNFSAALVNALTAQPDATGLLIDLRGNRGGVLRQAVLVADSLLPSGVIAAAAGRDPDAGQVFKAEGTDLTNGLKIIVLADGQTASAAEILAGALADNQRAVVIGSETLGKGLVQTVTELPDGGELYVTWSRVLAPRGWPIQALGVMPQICTSLGPQAVAAQLAALQNGSNMMAPELTKARAARAPLPVDQLLAIRNACPAAIGGSLDILAARSLMASTNAYHNALLLP